MDNKNGTYLRSHTDNYHNSENDHEMFILTQDVYLLFESWLGSFPPVHRKQIRTIFASWQHPQNWEKFRDIGHRSTRTYIHAEVRPNFPTAAARMAAERDTLCETEKDNPNIKQLSHEIKRQVNEHNKNKWRSNLEKCSFSQGTRSLWQTIKQLSCTKKKADNIAITFQGNHVPDGKKCANEFNRQYTPHPANLDKTIRNTIRKIHQLKKDSETITTERAAKAITKAPTVLNIACVLLKNILDSTLPPPVKRWLSNYFTSEKSETGCSTSRAFTNPL